MEDIRSVVRAELRQLAADNAAKDERAEPSSEARPEGSTDYAAGIGTIDKAVNAGLWSTEDRSRLREVLSTLAPDEKLKVVERLVVSINDGRMRVDTDDGSPF